MLNHKGTKTIETKRLILRKAIAEDADLLLATDPDCDRVGIAVRHNGEYKLMTGNEVGVMLCEYVLSRRKAMGTLPAEPIVIKSFVTTDLAQAVADNRLAYYTHRAAAPHDDKQHFPSR